MDERESERPPEEADVDQGSRPAGSVEGVRIIGAEEAQAAIEAGQVAGRRPEDAPRYGDRPPPPEGPRPPLRFPMGDRGDPTQVPRPKPGVDPPPGLRHWTEPPTGEHPRILPEGEGEPEDDDLGAWSSFASSGPRWRDQPADWEEVDYEDASVLADDDSRLGALDPGPGVADSFSFDEPEPAEAEVPPVDEVGPFRSNPADALTARGPTRRGGGRSRLGRGPDVPGPGVAAEEPALTGAGPATRPGIRITSRVPDAPAAPSTTTRRVRSRPGPDEGAPSGSGGGGGRDLGSAVGTGAAVAAAFLVALKVGPAATLLLVTVFIVMAAAELFAALRHRGYQPATLLGLVATASLCGAAYWKGEQAFPLVLALFVIFGLLWYLTGVVRANPALNVGASLLAFSYVGFLGAFAALTLRLPDDDGLGVLLGAVIATVAYDIAGYFVGSRMGHTPLAPAVSPNKTVEGLVGGTFGAVLASLVIVQQIHPWDFASAFLLGLVAAAGATLGDLCESMIKRDLDIKDMGSILPGHGGVLDRIDGLLFVVPAAYELVKLLDRV